jgi:hypothetical protein
MENKPHPAPEAKTETHAGKEVLCAYCHQQIQGTPIEKNGYLYHPGHERQDTKHPPRT